MAGEKLVTEKYTANMVCFITTKFNGFSKKYIYSGKPYEGKPHVRFDEGSRETGLLCYCALVLLYNNNCRFKISYGKEMVHFFFEMNYLLFNSFLEWTHIYPL